jgi:transcriptional regulator with XRE-family HTH domain
MDNVKQNSTFQPKPEQIRFAEIYLDYRQKLTFEKIAEQIGVDRTTIWNWFQKPDFLEWINEKATYMQKTALIPIIKSLIRKAEVGDVQAIKLYLEKIGEFSERLKVEVGWKD